MELLKILCDKCREDEVIGQIFDKSSRTWLGVCKKCKEKEEKIVN